MTDQQQITNEDTERFAAQVNGLIAHLHFVGVPKSEMAMVAAQAAGFLLHEQALMGEWPEKLKGDAVGVAVELLQTQAAGQLPRAS